MNLFISAEQAFHGSISAIEISIHDEIKKYMDWGRTEAYIHSIKKELFNEIKPKLLEKGFKVIEKPSSDKSIVNFIVDWCSPKSNKIID